MRHEALAIRAGDLSLPALRRIHAEPVCIRLEDADRSRIAAASGLPLLVSNRCGCAPELVHDGVNGFTFEPLDGDTLSELMARVAAPDFPRAEFGAYSREIVAAWGPERFGQGLAQAVDLALAGAPNPPGLVDRALLSLLARR